MAQNSNYSKNVDNVRLWHSPDSTRIVFDVSENVTHNMFTLDKPRRLVVDVQNAGISIALPTLQLDNPHISALRSGRPSDDTLRFVFELKQNLKATDFVLSPNELYGHRLVVDLQEENASKSITQQSPLSDTNLADRLVESKPRLETALAKPLPKIAQTRISRPAAKPLLIAIDAGHGGEDPGALGYRGSREKVLTLAIAKKLKKIVDADPKMNSFLVRKGDYYIKLDKRREMARAKNADMFISIHADAFRKRSAHGLSVFALSQRGATSAMARALAAKENASDLIGGVSLADKDAVLAKVLVDLSMNNTISESVNFGGRVLKELSKLGKLHSKKVEQANFAVLKSADIPSVLIETGFITNPAEEKNLRSARFQTKLARAIYTAIREYYEQTPYQSNAVYANVNSGDVRAKQGVYTSLVKPRLKKNGATTAKRKGSYKVVRGDSLSRIALRNGTSVRELKKLNNLRSNRVIVGQKLKLPGSSSSSQVSKSTKSNVKPAVYSVRSGDSLSKISARFNVTINSLKRLNGLKNNRLYGGQRLKIPGGVASYTAPKAVTHKVKRGDTLSEIAQRYGISQNAIMQENGLKSRLVRLGQRLKIPSSR